MNFICHLSVAGKTIQPGFVRWKCIPIPLRGLLRRGKLALLSASALISNSRHSAARICPSGEDVAARRQKGCISLARKGGCTVSLPKAAFIFIAVRRYHNLHSRRLCQTCEPSGRKPRPSLEPSGQDPVHLKNLSTPLRPGTRASTPTAGGKPTSIPSTPPMGYNRAVITTPSLQGGSHGRSIYLPQSHQSILWE